MSERFLTFAEVQERLGLSPDEVRALMEEKRLHGSIRDGVIKFPDSQVRALERSRKKSAPGAAGDSGLLFLVDEEEEKRIEGKAYDGEDLLKSSGGQTAAEDEEIMEPTELSEEQLRNRELLDDQGVVGFGREASDRAKRTFDEELAADEEILEPSDAPVVESEAVASEGPEPDEEILDPSEVALPERDSAPRIRPEPGEDVLESREVALPEMEAELRRAAERQGFESELVAPEVGKTGGAPPVEEAQPVVGADSHVRPPSEPVPAVGATGGRPSSEPVPQAEAVSEIRAEIAAPQRSLTPDEKIETPAAAEPLAEAGVAEEAPAWPEAMEPIPPAPVLPVAFVEEETGAIACPLPAEPAQAVGATGGRPLSEPEPLPVVGADSHVRPPLAEPEPLELKLEGEKEEIAPPVEEISFVEEPVTTMSCPVPAETAPAAETPAAEPEKAEAPPEVVKVELEPVVGADSYVRPPLAEAGPAPVQPEPAAYEVEGPAEAVEAARVPEVESPAEPPPVESATEPEPLELKVEGEVTEVVEPPAESEAAGEMAVFAEPESAEPEKLKFAEQETGPIACPLPVEPDVGATGGRPPSEPEPQPVVGADLHVRPPSEQEPAAPVTAPEPVEIVPEAESPAEPQPVESVAEPEPVVGADSYVRPPLAETPPTPVVEQPAEKPEEVPAAEAARESEAEPETFEVALPAPAVPVTERFERAVDEEVGELEEEPAAAELEKLSEPEPSAEPVSQAPEPQTVVGADSHVRPPSEPEAVVPVAKPKEAVGATGGRPPSEPVAEKPVEPSVFEPGPGAKDVWEEAEAEVLRGEESGMKSAGVESAVERESGEEHSVEEEIVSEGPAPPARAEKPGEEEEPVADQKKDEELPVRGEGDKGKPEQKPEDEGIEVFDLEEEGGKKPPAPVKKEEEDLVTLEEEAPAAGKEKSLDEEMAEIFGEGEAPKAEETFKTSVPSAEEDFDLSVFKEKPAEGVEEPVAVEEGSLFETGQLDESKGEDQMQAVLQREGPSRIKAITEEPAQPGATAFTVAVLLAFVVIAFTGMLLWHLAVGKL